MKNQSEIEQLLEQCLSKFPKSPDWIGLSTNIGDYVAHVTQPDIEIETDRMIALAGGAAGHYERHASEYQLGDAIYGLIVADDGCIVYGFVGADHIVAMLFRVTIFEDLPDILRQVPAVIETLASAM